MKTTIRSQAYAAIDSEREYQEALWAPVASEGKHTPLEFLAFIRSYTNEAMEISSRYADGQIHPDVMATIRKIGALAVACMEQHGAPHREFTTEEVDARRIRTPEHVEKIK